MNNRDFYHTTIDISVLGYVIRKLREVRGLTLRELSHEMWTENKAQSIDPSFISLVERGERIMSYAVLETLAKALRVDPKYLIAIALPIHPRLQGPEAPAGSDISKTIDNLVRQVQEIIAKEWFNTDLDSLIQTFLGERSKAVRNAET